MNKLFVNRIREYDPELYEQLKIDSYNMSRAEFNDRINELFEFEASEEGITAFILEVTLDELHPGQLQDMFRQLVKEENRE